MVKAVKHMGEAATTLLVAAAVWLVLAVIGALMTPPWQSPRYSDHLAMPTDDTAIAAADPAVGSGTPMGAYAVRESTVSIPLTASTSVSAIVREPIGAPGKRPAVLMLHGAGTSKAADTYGDIAPQLASAGIVTMVADKRLDTYSLTHRDYVAMARDYEHELDALRAMDDVDASRVGVYAESEGTWITAVMTAERPDIAFTVITSAPVYSGRQQMTAAASTYFTMMQAPQGVIDDIPKLSMLDYGITGLDYADFSALPYYERMRQPALVSYGTLDPSMSVEQGAAEIRDRAANGAGNRNVTLRYYPANHQLRLGSSAALPNMTLDPNYVRDVASWINAVAAGTDADGWRTPMLAGAQPQQMFAVQFATPRSPLTLTSMTQIAVLAAGGIGLPLLAGLIGLASRLGGGLGGRQTDGEHARARRRRRFGRGVVWRLAALGAGAAAAMLAASAGIAAIVVVVLQLHSDPALFRAGWTTVRGAGALVALLWALVIVRMLRGLGRAGHSGPPEACTSGVAAPIIAAMVLIGAAMASGVLAFWGAYAI